MSTQILIKRSTTTGAVPTTSDIATGELAINTVDKRIFTNNEGTIVELGTTPTTQAVTGNASVGGTFDVVGAVTVGNFTADGTVDLTSATVTIPAPTADTHPATKKYVDDEVNAILDGAPAALDTLNEIAAAINDDANAFTTLTNSIATKLPLAGGTMTGAIDMGANGITTSVDPATANTLTRKSYVDGLYQSTVDAEDSATAAAASATAAANSATSAASSASTATTQASNASTSATNAATSATNAGNSATSAANSATASATSATQSASSASAAATSETNAATSATNAATSATEAQTIVDSLGDVVLSTGDTMTGNLNFGDNDKAVFGAGSDLQIYHDGEHSYITEGGDATGNLYIRASQAIALQKQDGTEDYITAVNNGAVTLYNNNAPKLATTSTGVDVTGTVTADGLTVDGTGSPSLNFSAARGMVESVGGLTLDIDSNSNTTTDTFLITRDGTTANLFRADENGDISFYEDTGTTAKFFWDASAESLGIGTSSPTNKLSVSTSAYSNSFVPIQDLKYNTFDVMKLGYTGSSGSIRTGTIDTGVLGFTVNTGDGSERMRIDSSGNLLVGQTSAGVGIQGATIYSNGLGKFNTTDARPLYLRREGTDGDLIEFVKDTSTVGSIGKNSTGLYLSGASGVVFSSFNTLPAASTGAAIDNNKSLGSSSNRWDDIYATNGTIQTSDEREKQDIDVLSDAEQRVAVACKGLLRKFRWKDAVAEKGDNARIHFGIIAQDLKAAFEAEGLDAGDYAMFIHTTWWEHSVEVPAVEAQEAVYETQVDEEGNETQVLVSEAVEGKEAYTRTDTYETAEEAPEGAVERDRMGVRYPELLAFIIASI